MDDWGQRFMMKIPRWRGDCYSHMSANKEKLKTNLETQRVE